MATTLRPKSITLSWLCSIVLLLFLLMPSEHSLAEPSLSISNCTGLQNMTADLAGNYELTGNINCSASATWNGGLGFSPIGHQADPFTGSFDGQGFAISGLTIHWPGYLEVGLFGNVGSGVEIKDVHLVNVDIGGTWYVGGLAGVSSGQLTDISVSGIITGSTYGVGGLVGRNNDTINRASSTATVISLDKDAGGLVGSNSGLISQSYATGPVNSKGNAGGLAGFNAGMISQSYAQALVETEEGSAGGLVGSNFGGALILNAYAAGGVSGGSGASVNVGGLVGVNYNGLGGPAYVRNCYSRGLVSGGVDSNLGGLIGKSYTAPDAITHSYWDRITSGQIASDGGTSKTTVQMMQQATYETWDYTFIWRIEEGLNYPQLSVEPVYKVNLPAVMHNAYHLYVQLGILVDENGVYLQDGGDTDTLVYVFSTSPDLSAHGTGNGEILPSPDSNQIPDWYMQFDLDDAVLFAEPADTTLWVQIDFVDIGTDTFRIEYDAHTGGPLGDGRFKSTYLTNKSNTGSLRTTYYVLDEVNFANRTNGGDFRINDMRDGTEYIRKVTIWRLPPGP